jgi:myosin heavy subunit
VICVFKYYIICLLASVLQYFDNKVVVDLIEQKVGILAILDDQQSFKNCSPETFTVAIKNSLGSNSHLVHPDVYARKNTSKTDFRFGIRHYAGEVCYNAVSFLDKNVDSLYEDVMKVMRTSRSPFIAELFADRRTDEEKSKRPPTIGNQFKKHLADLVGTLKECKPHYVRCIKPNDVKSADFTDTDRLIHQIQYLGIVENVKVRRAGYCLRTVHKDFLFRYRILSAATWPRCRGDPAANARLILQGDTPTAWQHLPAVSIPSMTEGTDYVMGSTKVFIKEPLTLFALENARSVALYGTVRLFQTSARKFVKLRQYKRIRKGFIRWQASARAFLGQKHYKRSLYCLLKTQCLIRRFIERCRFRKLMARCKGVPPRVFACKVQARARGMKTRTAIKSTDPEKYAKLEKCTENAKKSGIKRIMAIAKLRVRTRFIRLMHISYYPRQHDIMFHLDTIDHYVSKSTMHVTFVFCITDVYANEGSTRHCQANLGRRVQRNVVCAAQ